MRVFVIIVLLFGVLPNSNNFLFLKKKDNQKGWYLVRSINPNFFFAKVLPDSNNYEYTYTLHASQRRLQAAYAKRAVGQETDAFRQRESFKPTNAERGSVGP